MDEAAARVVCEDYEEEEMRLIDADALKVDFYDDYETEDGDEYSYTYVSTYQIDNAPTIDAVPVVRCADCKCWTEWSNGTGSCSRFALDWIGTDADDFCSMGERKDDED